MRRGLTVTTLLAVIALRCVAACVDGVTPDCSNASVCSPSEGPLGPAVDAATTTDSATTDAATKPETSTAADASDSG